MSRIIAMVNQKGGVAKTTSTLNVAAGLACMGKKVLLVDFDPQANLTESCGHSPDEIDTTIYNVIIGNVNMQNVIITLGDNLYLAPSNIELSGAEAELLQLPGKDYRLKKVLETIDGFDYIIIDCPPSLGQLTLNALAAATEVFIPVLTEYFAFKATRKLTDTINMVKEWSNENIKITGVIATRYNSRKILNQGVLEELKENFGNKLFNTMIRENIKIAEAPAVGKNIFDYAPNSHGAEDYKSLCEEIIKMEVK